MIQGKCCQCELTVKRLISHVKRPQCHLFGCVPRRWACSKVLSAQGLILSTDAGGGLEGGSKRPMEMRLKVGPFFLKRKGHRSQGNLISFVKKPLVNVLHRLVCGMQCDCVTGGGAGIKYSTCPAGFTLRIHECCSWRSCHLATVWIRSWRKPETAHRQAVSHSTHFVEFCWHIFLKTHTRHIVLLTLIWPAEWNDDLMVCICLHLSHIHLNSNHNTSCKSTFSLTSSFVKDQ